jgi:biotin carboxyl carrier protein
MSTLKFIQIAIGACILAFFSCKNISKEDAEVNSIRTPVSTETLRAVAMDEIVNLSAVSAYLKKETVRSSSSGYIVNAKVILGEKIHAGEMIMLIKTKEASALKTIPQDSALHISGLIEIKANSDGIIAQMDHHQGDFISEGDPLVTLAQPGSLVFYLKVPYAEHAAIHLGESYPLILPDGKKIMGKISRVLTTMEAGSQSEDYLIEPITGELIPENLWIQVPVKKLSHKGNFSLLKACVQSNEAQTEFWVMRLKNDSIAIKINITKGIESDSLVEILSPRFDVADRFVSKGSYGLSDTAKIEISK